jgi:hypothetical protein
MNGNLGMLRCLLDAGAIPDAPAKNGSTPMKLAMAFGFPEAEALLISAQQKRMAVMQKECEALSGPKVDLKVPRQQAVKKLQSSVVKLKSTVELDAAMSSFKKLDQLAQGLQRLTADYKPLNKDRKLLVDFLKQKIDDSYKAYSASSSLAAESSALMDLNVTAKLVRDQLRTAPSKPGLFNRVRGKTASEVDTLEAGITNMLEMKH